MIEKLPGHYSMTNPATVYDEEAMTSIELAGRIRAKVNELVDLVNKMEGSIDGSLLQQTNALKEALETTIPASIETAIEDHINGGSFVAQINAYLNNLNERVDNILATVHAGSTTGDAELHDIRVDGDGYTHPTAGNAVRSLYKDVHGALQSGSWVTTPAMVVGGLTDGEPTAHAGRIRFSGLLPCYGTVITTNPVYNMLVGWHVYDVNGVWDGVDHGWNASPVKIEVQSGYVSLCYRRVDDANVVEDDLYVCRAMTHITESKTLRDLYDLPRVSIPVTCEYGTITNGEPEDTVMRVRMTDKVKVTPKAVICYYLTGTSVGWSFYGEDGNWDGVDHGWTPCTTKEVIIQPLKPGYIRLNYKNDTGDFEPADFASATYVEDVVSPDEVVRRLTALENQTPENPTPETGAGGSCSCDAEQVDFMQSVEIKRNRLNKASYTVVRIPKTSVGGRSIRPKLRLAKSGGQSALEYAEEHGSLMTINAGLFNIPEMTPNGKTRIDGVTLVSTPLTNDNGTVISGWPLALIFLPDGRLVSENPIMGVDSYINEYGESVECVQGWGRVVDNFLQTSDASETDWHTQAYVRQVIGQYANGDYMVLTVDGPSGTQENEYGLTYEYVSNILSGEGVKFAYSLDGGGSCETVIGQKHVNPIYEGEKGRKVVTLITFDFE